MNDDDIIYGMTQKTVRIAMLIIGITALGATTWALSTHNRYLVSRFLALFSISLYVGIFPDHLIENLKTRTGRRIIFGAVGLLAFVGLFLSFVFCIVKPAQDAHATWLPKTFRNWCADPSMNRPGSTGPDCQ